MVFAKIVTEIPESDIQRCKIGTEATDLEQFCACWEVISDLMCNDLEQFGDLAEDAKAWFKEQIHYNAPGGKMNRGLSVLHTYRHLKPELSDTDVFRCFILGWCVELLQAFFLVSDDIMDGSITRRGHPCWFRVKKVGLIAINDAFMLEMMLYKLLKTYFGQETYYMDLVELFLQTTWQTEIGQLHDLITAPVGDVNLNRFSIEKYKLIVKYKTAFYSFYLPVAEALLMAGITDNESHDIAKKILLVMGEYFQIQDDYLDCYGAPEVIGKIGTDIEDNKCGWLVVQALDRVTPEQRAVLDANYGRPDEENVIAVKKIYEELNLEKVFKDYEEKTYAELLELVKEASGSMPAAIFMDFATKIFKRTK